MVLHMEEVGHINLEIVNYQIVPKNTAATGHITTKTYMSEVIKDNYTSDFELLIKVASSIKGFV